MRPEVPKRPYKVPKLQVYGDIRELTQTVGAHGKADGGSKSKSKTSP